MWRENEIKLVLRVTWIVEREKKKEKKKFFFFLSFGHEGEKRRENRVFPYLQREESPSEFVRWAHPA